MSHGDAHDHAHELDQLQKRSRKGSEGKGLLVLEFLYGCVTKLSGGRRRADAVAPLTAGSRYRHSLL